MASYMPGHGGGVGNGTAGAPPERERGSRRRKLAAMAASAYRAGATAVREIKESYDQTRVRDLDTPEGRITIPGSFPEVSIITKGNEQMVLFPSYAKRHERSHRRQYNAPGGPPNAVNANINDQQYWQSEWSRNEDEKAIVDVDVRGWVYNPHKGPITRRNRILIGLARQLSGIPVPKPQVAEPGMESSATEMHRVHEEEKEQQRIALQAKEIERRGQSEKEAATQGRYSERPKDADSEDEGDRGNHSRSASGNITPISAPTSPTLSGRTNTMGASDLTEAELAVANANLMARIGPFMTIPLVQLPVTVFFYDDEHSQSRTIHTNDAGHFIMRAALDFLPTHVRVLANEDLSAIEPVQVTEPRGISVISDIDDTIKRSNIFMGAKEIFRNTFIRDLADLTVDGVREWYNAMHDMGVKLHYCSNSPWQLYPVIASFFKLAGLPPGSIHLKQYSGMLQGIFEPVAERKKGTLEKIMKDFPERRFLLVGDSGEADLEVYTELALANPGRIVAILIRDITTPEQKGYFDSAFSLGEPASHRRFPSIKFDDSPSRDNDPPKRPNLHSRTASESGPIMGSLIDLSDEPDDMTLDESKKLADSKHHAELQELCALPERKKPPPRPIKPSALQGSSALLNFGNPKGSDLAQTTPPIKKLHTPGNEKPPALPPHPLSQMQNSSSATLTGSSSTLKKGLASPIPTSRPVQASANQEPVPPPPPPRRRHTPSSILTLSPRLRASRRSNTSGSNSDVDSESLPSTSYPPNNYGGSSWGTGRITPGRTTPISSPTLGPVNKKLDLWRRRLQRAQDTLEAHGVRLYTWKKGDDVVEEALGLIKEELAKINRNQGRR